MHDAVSPVKIFHTNYSPLHTGQTWCSGSRRRKKIRAVWSNSCERVWAYSPPPPLRPHQWAQRAAVSAAGSCSPAGQSVGAWHSSLSPGSSAECHSLHHCQEGWQREHEFKTDMLFVATLNQEKAELPERKVCTNRLGEDQGVMSWELKAKMNSVHTQELKKTRMTHNRSYKKNVSPGLRF